MRSMILAVAAGASLAFAGAGAEAMPAGAVVGAPAPAITLVSGGCGVAFHRTPAGFCVRNFVRVYRPAYGYYGPRYYRPYARCGVRVGPIGIGGPC